MDKTSMTLGYLVGRQIAGQRRAKPAEHPEPSFQPPMGSGEYVFNGVRLPAFPEYDQTVYRYATIGMAAILGIKQYNIYVFADYDDSGEYISCSNAMHTPMPSGATEWGEWTKKDVVSTLNRDKIFWSNFDIKNADGSIFLEAIPVYE